VIFFFFFFHHLLCIKENPTKKKKVRRCVKKSATTPPPPKRRHKNEVEIETKRTCRLCGSSGRHDKTVPAGDAGDTKTKHKRMRFCVSCKVTKYSSRECKLPDGENHKPFSKCIGYVVADFSDPESVARTKNIQPHLSKRSEQFQKEADQDSSPRAMLRFGNNLLLGTLCPKDTTRGVVYIKRAADRGLIGAIFLMGTIYFTGKYLPHADYPQAVHYFHQGLLQKHALSTHMLSLCFYRGLGVPVSNQKGGICTQLSKQFGYDGEREKMLAIAKE